MGLIWGRKKSQKESMKKDAYSSVEVTALNRRTHQTAEQANRDIDKLNRLLKANGITLKIHIASGGHSGKH